MPNRLGLAYKAQKLAIGFDFVLESVRNKQAKLVFLASDAGFNTKKSILDKCKFYDVEVTEMFDTETLSQAVGKMNIKVLAILDSGFAGMYKK